MLCGLFCMCIRYIGMFSEVVVFSVFFWCSVYMLLIMLVLVVIVVCIILGLEVLIEIGIVQCVVSVLIIGSICVSFVFSDMLVVLGWVDLLFMLSMFVFCFIIVRLCVIVVLRLLYRLLLENELGVMLRMLMMCGWFSVSRWLLQLSMVVNRLVVDIIGCVLGQVVQCVYVLMVVVQFVDGVVDV